MNAKTEAIAAADAHLNNAGLPTYTELLAALRDLHFATAFTALKPAAQSARAVSDDLIARAN